MNLNLAEDRKVAVVTGASRGLGAALCRMLSEENYHIALGARDLAALSKLRGELPNSDWHSTHQLDLEDPQSVERFASEIVECHGRIDLLVNNAGVGVFERLEELTIDEFDEIYRINVRGPWLLTKHTLPLLKQYNAMVVMVSSDVSTRTFPNGGIYTASKFALRAITRTFQQENPDLRFLELRPGAIDSYFAGSTQGAGEKMGFLQTITVAESLRAVLKLPPEARVEELVLRSRDQAIEY